MGRAGHTQRLKDLTKVVNLTTIFTKSKVKNGPSTHFGLIIGWLGVILLMM